MSANNILRQKLIECEALKFGDFTLTSGKKSSYYVNMKLASTNPDILKLISIEFAKLIPNGTDFIAGMELGAVPLAVALSLETGLPYTMIRKGERKHGTGSRLEGPSKGKAILVDDVATTGGSNVESLEVLLGEGIDVTKILVVVDREEGAHEKLKPYNVSFRSLISASELSDK
ncbi:MAG: orotate phosphoribosyltransferase [Marine Group III euryarchaeote CG-Epi3]|jgi:orotate phosphoribosyltransferase|uniref:Orotate phosphoribosyltransferase n=1 Tax=Marine Group III euryarchaeote CG-Epi3 TaxID=1888997 RepID=A0A1J5UFJ8_9ARCH|nr:MAG: orotate phosphoribosyltransferase [Marine Group III euryarchaeote CG-Epi3]|tara:strand:- start:582 stop:1103 length:522 start_codon:yes stop_codon:yes gene_type:complete